MGGEGWLLEHRPRTIREEWLALVGSRSRGKNNHGNPQPLLFDRTKELLTAHVRHVEVSDDEVDALAAHQLERVDAVLGLEKCGATESDALKAPAAQFASQRGIIHDEDREPHTLSERRLAGSLKAPQR